jgi:hypothetical protein
MAKYFLTVNFDGGAVSTPMDEWEPADVAAHLDYYRVLNRELTERGELVASEAFTGPDAAKIVTSDGAATQVLDGPFAEFKEWLAGYQIVDVESEERALAIAAQLSAVPGPGGVACQQPIHVRRMLDDSPTNPDEMTAWLADAQGDR